MMYRSYVLITPARNEEENIEKTIQSVVSQTSLPKKWVIVNDGSTDRTDEIVSRYAARYSFIELIRVADSCKYNFGSKVHAFNAGYAKINDVDYDYIGNLDADITFQHDYCERILTKLEDNEKLGIAGGMVLERLKGKFVNLDYNVNSVAGAVQMFKRRCFEEIGGYLPLQYGGIDAVAEIMSRMHGWEVRSFKDIVAYHNRRIGTTQESIIQSRFRYGVRDYSFGTHPLFMLLKSLHRFIKRPYIIGALLTLSGYAWSWIQREPKAVSEEIVRFLRKEQMSRILSKLKL